MNFKKIINPRFIKNNAKKVKKEDLINIVSKTRQIYEKLQAGNLKDLFENVTLALNLIKDYIKGDYRAVSWHTIAMLAFTLLYLLNPMDLVPDVIPIIGLGDDAFLIITSFKMLSKELEDYKIWKESQTNKEFPDNNEIIDVTPINSNLK